MLVVLQVEGLQQRFFQVPGSAHPGQWVVLEQPILKVLIAGIPVLLEQLPFEVIGFHFRELRDNDQKIPPVEQENPDELLDPAPGWNGSCPAFFERSR